MTVLKAHRISIGSGLQNCVHQFDCKPLYGHPPCFLDL